MDGFLLVNKPQGLTSFDVCNKLRKILKTKKIGHSGTLDPLATGLLIIGVGRATKLLNYLENETKVYEAGITFGVDTDTYDILGNVIHQCHDFNLNDEIINDALKVLKQTKSQIPPIYSAIKVNGQKLYDYALKGEDVLIKPRPIKIDILERCSSYQNGHVTIRIKANKGFYVRSLVHDLGVMLNTYAAMDNLVRTNCGDYSLNEAIDLSEVTEKQALISIEDVFKKLPSIHVDSYLAHLVINGIVLDERQFKTNSLFKVYDEACHLIAIYEPVANLRFKPVVILR